MRHLTLLPCWACLLICLGLACARPPAQTPATLASARYDVEEKTLAQLQADLAAGRISSERLVETYLERIAALDARGPALHSVLAQNPRARAEARERDAERARGQVRSILHGIPILLKDNIESADPMPTTAGSLALAQNFTGRDAPLVAQLRRAGAIVLGKSNMSEWANFRSSHATSGWSALGGLTKNPYALDRNPCGSSSGSGTAVSANLAALAVGTETDGSITCPASMLGLVGLKPTLGLVSRTRIIPISSAQDTAGPLARTVTDAAHLLTAIAGTDPEDPGTRDAAQHVRDYSAELSADALRGRRFGVMRFYMGYLPQVDALFDAAVAALRDAGAEVVDLEGPPGLDAIHNREQAVLLADFRRELNAYLATTPPQVKARTLAQLIAFNREHAAQELAFFDQELFERAEATRDGDPVAQSHARAENQSSAAALIDALLHAHSLDAMIAPTASPAFMTDLVNGDHVLGSATTLPAVAGYPHLTVPMGQVSGLPVGLSFVGPAWSEARLLAFGYAYEQRTRLRRAPALGAHDLETTGAASRR